MHFNLVTGFVDLSMPAITGADILGLYVMRDTTE